jgi:hypothetical protein
MTITQRGMGLFLAFMLHAGTCGADYADFTERDYHFFTGNISNTDTGKLIPKESLARVEQREIGTSTVDLLGEKASQHELTVRSWTDAALRLHGKKAAQTIASIMILTAGATALYKLTAAERVTPESYQRLSAAQQELLWKDLPDATQEAVYDHYMQSAQEVPAYMVRFEERSRLKFSDKFIKDTTKLLETRDSKQGEQFYLFLDPQSYKDSIVKPVASFADFIQYQTMPFEDTGFEKHASVLKGLKFYNGRHDHYSGCTRCQENQYDLCAFREKYKDTQAHYADCGACKSDPLLTCKESVVCLAACEKALPSYFLSNKNLLTQLIEFQKQNPEKGTWLVDRLASPWQILRKEVTTHDRSPLYRISDINKDQQQEHLAAMGSVYLARGLGWSKPAE